MLGYFLRNWHNLLISAAFLGGAILVALIGHVIVFWLLRRLAQRKGALLGRSLATHADGPTRWIFPLLAVLAILPGLPLTPGLLHALEHITGLGLIAATAWLVILSVEIFSDILTGKYRVDVSDNLTARRIQTQFQMLHRIVVVLVIIVTLAIMLMTFPAIKHIGESVLASAGLATLVVGLAMKGTLSNLVAGLQIAFTQPFRIEDAVVLEGEWGWIEEVGTMYVVVRLWDLRRLVLPLSYFLDHPFQNWTRTSADLLAHCYIYTDYTVPVDAMRAELRRICESTPLWGGKVCVLQVSQLEQFTVQVPRPHGRTQLQRRLGHPLPRPRADDRLPRQKLPQQPPQIPRGIPDRDRNRADPRKSTGKASRAASRRRHSLRTPSQNRVMGNPA